MEGKLKKSVAKDKIYSSIRRKRKGM